VFYFRSPEFKEIVRACLNKDAFQRPSAKQLQQVHLIVDSLFITQFQTGFREFAFRIILLSGYFAVCLSNISADYTQEIFLCLYVLDLSVCQCCCLDSLHVTTEED